MFLRARTYDPAIGRFLQRDSLLPDPKDPESLNRYTYVADNPSTYNDPSGHQLGWFQWFSDWMSQQLNQASTVIASGGTCGWSGGGCGGAFPDYPGSSGFTGFGPALGYPVHAPYTAGCFPPGSLAYTNALGYYYGCHTCGMPFPGIASGNWVQDHWPPTSMMTWLPPGTPQFLLPQCVGCMHSQGGNVNAYNAALQTGDLIGASLAYNRIVTPYSQMWPTYPAFHWFYRY